MSIVFVPCGKCEEPEGLCECACWICGNEAKEDLFWDGEVLVCKKCCPNLAPKDLVEPSSEP